MPLTGQWPHEEPAVGSAPVGPPAETTGVAEEATIHVVYQYRSRMERDRLINPCFSPPRASFRPDYSRHWQLDTLCSARIMCSHTGSEKFTCQSSESAAHSKKKERSEHAEVGLWSRFMNNDPVIVHRLLIGQKFQPALVNKCNSD